MQPTKVVITGASGFLGGSVLRRLEAQQDVEVIPVTRKEIPGWYHVSTYAEAPPGDVLIHLAQCNDRARVAQSGRAYEEDALATLMALLAKGYRRVVYASSAILYGDTDRHAHFPGDPVRCDDAYARIKWLSEIEVLKLSAGMVVRLANVYGPGMSENNVISAILEQVPGEGPLEVMDTSPVRDYIWAADAAAGIVALALGNCRNDACPRIYNLGTGVGTSVGAVAKLVLEIAGQHHRSVMSRHSTHKQSTLILDYSDTTAACGWRPQTSLRQGLASLL